MALGPKFYINIGFLKTNLKGLCAFVWWTKVFTKMKDYLLFQIKIDLVRLDIKSAYQHYVIFKYILYKNTLCYHLIWIVS